MRRIFKKRSERQTLDETQETTKIFSPEELADIRMLLTDLRKIRQVSKTDADVETQIDLVLEQQFFYVGDFIVSKNWENDRLKIEALFRYLKTQLS